MSDQFILPHNEYAECKDAGICKKDIPADLLLKYAGNKQALERLTEAHTSGKKLIKKAHIKKGQYAEKMRGKK